METTKEERNRIRSAIRYQISIGQGYVDLGYEEALSLLNDADRLEQAERDLEELRRTLWYEKAMRDTAERQRDEARRLLWEIGKRIAPIDSSGSLQERIYATRESDMETTKEERDEMRRRRGRTPDHVWRRVLNDADRLAAIERQVLWRTEDTPSSANGWCKFWSDAEQGFQCAWVSIRGPWANLACEAPDYRPDEPGPIWLPILDPLET